METMPDVDHAAAEAILQVRRETDRAIERHANQCQFAKLDIEKRMRGIETRFAAMVGLMAGGGFLGGAAGSLVVKVLGG
jgi:hypothetical protein